MIVMLIMTLQMTAFMGRIAVCAFYVIYCLGSFTLIALIMTIPSIGAVIGSFFVPMAAKKFGKRKCPDGLHADSGSRAFSHLFCTV